MTILYYALLLVPGLINNVALSSTQQGSRKPPLYKTVPETSFSCAGRPAGYYGDPEAGCHAYHMCDMLGKKYSYLCPLYTLFNQKYMVCDHWHAVDCSTAESFYHLNLKIGQVPSKTSSQKKSSLLPSRKRSHPSFKASLPSAQKSPANKPLKGKSKPPRSEAIHPSTPNKAPTLKQSRHLDILERSLVFPTSNHHTKEVNKAIKSQINDQRSRFPSKFNSDFSSIKLRPLFKKNSNFTAPLHSFTVRTTSSPSHNFSLEDSLKTTRAVTDLLIPPKPLIVNRNTLLAPFLLPPPPESPVVLDGNNQEMQTPLILSSSRNSRHKPHLQPPQFFRDNRAFFIPTSNIVPPLSFNSLQFDRSANEDLIIDDHINHNKGRMTMTFPNTASVKRGQLLKLNPKCPQCHPAFLRFNECQPCVIIK